MSKPSKNDSQPAPSGRIAFDDRGKAVWEWRTDTGTFKTDIDTKQVKALQEATNVDISEAPTPPASDDPYSTGDKSSLIAKRAPRRTLDDMRKLSEEIKRARKRTRNRPRPHARACAAAARADTSPCTWAPSPLAAPQALSNCCSSVLPASAVIDDVPPATVCVTASKYPAPTSRWCFVAV